MSMIWLMCEVCGETILRHVKKGDDNYAKCECLSVCESVSVFVRVCRSVSVCLSG